MKKLLVTLLLLSGLAFGQSVLPNISYSAQLNASCTNANTACSNAVFVTGFGGTGNQASFGTGAALDIPVANYSAATITVSGTYSNVTLNFDFSDPTSGINYFQEVCARTDINLLEVSEVLPTNQVRAWQCPVWAATRLRIRNSNASVTGGATIWVTLTQAAIDPSLVVAASITNIAGASDPCADVSAIKQTAFANITTATTTALVAPSGTTNIYVCSYQVTSFSTTAVNTVILENGTGAACATSPTALTPTYTNSGPATIPIIWHEGPGATLFASGASQGLCALTTVGTAPIIGVKISYVQQ